jgi:hypothetical protein
MSLRAMILTTVAIYRILEDSVMTVMCTVMFIAKNRGAIFALLIITPRLIWELVPTVGALAF